MTNTGEENQIELGQIGQLLKEAREQKQLSLKQVAEKTRIHINILQSIEDGKIASNPGPVFIRGFIRTYGKFVGVELESFLEKLNAVTELQEPETLDESSVLLFPEPETSFFQEQKLLVVLLVVLVIGGGYFLIHQISSQFFADYLPAQPSAQQELVSENAPNPAQPEVPAQPAAETESASPPTPSQTVLPPEEVPATTPTVVSVEPSSEESEIVTEPESLELTIKATLASWIAITIDEDAPIEVFLQPGEEYSLEAKERYLLTIGNAKGVELFLNGDLKTIESQNELLENWVIDKSMLALE